MKTLENVWSLSSPYGFRSTSKQIKFTGISSLNSRDTKRSFWLMNWSQLWRGGRCTRVSPQWYKWRDIGKCVVFELPLLGNEKQFGSTSKQIQDTGISSLNSRDTKRSSWLMNWSHLWPAPGGGGVQKWTNSDTNEETLENVWSLAPSSGKWRAETSREIKWDFPLFTGLTFGLTVTKR